MQFLPFALFGIVFFCGVFFIISWIVMLFRLSKLNRYLKKHNYQKWRELSSIGSYGPGLSNPLRGIRYLFSNSQEKDEALLRLKDSAKIISIYSFVSAASLVASIIIAILAMIFLDQL